ncbi:MAG TPA: TM2 domain-containing protein [Anaeromyxobacteraceae bacterium]|nr:TM2 domain-containing protein [Anaeromyxobacteraceae bacterium]
MTGPATPLGPGQKYCHACAAVLDAAAQTCSACGTSQAPRGGRSKIAAALLAFFLGGVGAHKFYLGRWGWGIVYLLFFWTLLPGLVALVEFVLLLVMPEEKFQAKYGGGGGGGAVVVIVIVVLLGGIAMVGVLAAIAIPNFIRYQLRAKSAELSAQVKALHQAEETRGFAGHGFLAFPDGLPAGGVPGSEKMAWSEEDRAVASQLGWEVGPGTYGRYAVAVAQDQAGNAAFSICGEADLDDDDRFQAVVLFRPAVDSAGAVVLGPPLAPCGEEVVLAVGASLEAVPGLPVGLPLKVSPDDVF